MNPWNVANFYKGEGEIEPYSNLQFYFLPHVEIFEEIIMFCTTDKTWISEIIKYLCIFACISPIFCESTILDPMIQNIL